MRLSLRTIIILLGCSFFANAPVLAADADEEFGHKKMASLLMRCGGSMTAYLEKNGSFTDKTGQVWDNQSMNTLIGPVFLQPGAFLFLYDRNGWTLSSGKPISGEAAEAMKAFGATESGEAAAIMSSSLEQGYGKEFFGNFWETCSTVAVIANKVVSDLNK